MAARDRVARHRASGVRIDVVLTDPAVIAAWRALVARCQSQREAVALAVVLAAGDVSAADREADHAQA